MMKKCLKALYKPVKARMDNYKRKKEIKRLESKVEKFCNENNIAPISSDSHKEICNFWSSIVGYNIKPYYYNMLNCFHFEYPLYQAVNEAIMYPSIIRKLNPIEPSKVLANKNLYGVLFKDINRPTEFLRNCNGILLDNDNQLISLSEGIDRIISYGEDVIIKPTIDTYGGHGVKIISNYNREILNDIVKSYGVNYVIQALVKQSAQTKKFNPTSLNTFRIITLLLNGKVTVLSSIFRCGGKNAVVDNASSGGMFVGIKEDGQLTRGTSYSTLIIEESPEGLKYSEHQIEHFERVLDFAKDLHTRIPLCAFAGWDIALDENNVPVFMEVNLNCPDVWLMQILNGPIFKDRFDEVIEFIKSCKKN